MNLLFLIYVVFTNPILLTILCVAVGAVIIAAINSSNAKRQTREQAASAARLSVIQAENDAAVKRAEITDKYDAQTAERILNGQIWQGMTAEQLRYSVGEPVAVDMIVTKRTSKEVWKYWQQTATRFDLRVTLEKGLVVGWQMK
jgi:hypothetical protein